MQSATPGLRLRPLPLSDLLDETFNLYRQHFGVLAATAFLVSLPSLIISFLSGEAMFGMGQLFQQLRPSQTVPPGTLATVSAWSGVAAIVGLVMVPFTAGALYRGAMDAAQGKPVAVGSILRGVLDRYFSIWGLVLIYVVGALALIIPPGGIWLLVRWSVGLPALFGENAGALGAAGRSWSLVAGHWWRTFGRLIVLFLLVAVLTAIVSSILGIAALLPGLSLGVRAGIDGLASTVANAVLAPISAIAVTLIYFDLRVRKEGLDLQQMARDAGGGGPAGWAPSGPPSTPPPGPPSAPPSPWAAPPPSGAWPPPAPPVGGEGSPEPPAPESPGGPAGES